METSAGQTQSNTEAETPQYLRAKVVSHTFMILVSIVCWVFSAFIFIGTGGITEKIFTFAGMSCTFGFVLYNVRKAVDFNLRHREAVAHTIKFLP